MAIIAVLGAAVSIPATGLAGMAGAPAPAAAPAASLVVPVGGCHESAQYHYVPEFGYRARHFHRGPRCRVVEYERYEDDLACHDDPARHSHAGYGRVLHRHGRRCQVRVLRRIPGPAPSGACVTIGPVTFCE